VIEKAHCEVALQPLAFAACLPEYKILNLKWHEEGGELNKPGNETTLTYYW
jgi:hypothetical protein